jgi:hypothetical protein
LAITLDANLGTGKGHATSSWSLVTTNAVATGGCIILGVACFASGSVTGFTVSGGGLTWNTGSSFIASGSLKIRVFYAFAPSGLASGTTLSISDTGGGANDNMAAAISLLGVNTTGTISSSAGSGATGAGWSTGNILANNGDAMVGFAFEDGSGTATSTPTSPAVEFADFNDATQTEAFTAAYKLTVAGTDVIAGTWSASVTHIRAGVSLTPAAGGGTSFPRSCTDSIAVSESLARSLALPRAISDTVGLSESLARTVVLPRAVTDAVTLADAADRSLGHTVTATDSLTVTDAATRAAQTFTRTAADAVGIAEAITSPVGHPRSVTDAVTVADAAARSALNNPRAVTDAVTVADNATSNGGGTPVSTLITLPATGAGQ